MPLRVQSQLEGGFGTSITVAPSGSSWVASTTNVANVWRGTELVHVVRVTGHVGGRGQFNSDESSVVVGLYTIDTASGELLRQITEPRWLTSNLGDDDDDADLSPPDFTAPMVVHLPGSDRAVVQTRYQPPRLKGSSSRFSGPKAQVLLVDLGADEVVSELMHDASRHHVVIDATSDVVAAATHHDVHVWSSAAGDSIATWTIDGMVDAIAVSPDSRAVAVLTRAGDITIWATDGQALSTWHAHDGAGSALAWAHSGEWLATGSRDGNIGVWATTAATHPELIGAHATDSNGGIAVMPGDGALIVAGDVVDQSMAILTLDR